jgi:hypothetical protein
MYPASRVLHKRKTYSIEQKFRTAGLGQKQNIGAEISPRKFFYCMALHSWVSKSQRTNGSNTCGDTSILH